MTKEGEGVLMKWVKVGLVALLFQFAGWVGSTIWGYATINAEVKQLRMLLEEHTHAQDSFVRRDVWETRNGFIDAKMEDIDKKLEELIQVITYEGIYVEPGAGARYANRKATKK